MKPTFTRLGLLSLGLILLCFFNSFARNPSDIAAPKSLPPTNPYRTKMNDIFGNLNKTYITTGYLAEYAFPFVSLEDFNGTVGANNVTNSQIWQMAYATWYSSYIASASVPGASPNAVSTAIREALINSTSAVPISLLYAKYNSLKSNAVSSNLLSVSNDKLYDVSGRSQSPYDQRSLFVAAPARSFSNTNALSFIFDSNLSWGNGGSISSIQIDFGNGYQSVSWGTPVNFTFSSKGVKRVKVKITSSSGSALESHFDIQIRQVDVCTNCRYATDVYDYVQLFYSSGNHSGGRAYVKYSQSNTTNPRRIRKPLIVAEGYDISRISPSLAYNYTYKNFVRALNELGGVNPNSYDFNQALDNAGYDLVFLDYGNGTDNIQRNATLLQEVITWVNNQKQASDPENVVMGLSMGGLVARYALANMVRNGLSTKTRLLITHDSPHRGAHVPLGIQMAARAAADINFSLDVFGITSLSFNARDAIPELDQLMRLYEAPATTEMLLVKATDGSGATANNTYLDATYRDMVNLSSTPYRIVATSDGSQCGSALFAPSSQLAGFSAFGFISPIPWLSNNRLKTDLTINASANQQGSQLVNLKVYSSWKLLSLITINITLFERSINGPAVPFYDGAAGGTYEVSAYLYSDVKLSGSYKVLWFLQAGYSVSLRDEFCFVPTPSALDITTFNASSLTASYVDAVSPSNPSRMSKFIAQEIYTRPNSSTTAKNEAHIRFTARNSQWLYNEMENPPANTLHCTNECPLTGLSISGPGELCNTANYTVSPSLGSAALAWASSNTNAFTIVSSSGAATKVNNGFPSTITAYVNNCNVGLTKSIYVGAPAMPTLTINGVAPYGVVDATASPVYIVTPATYRWYRDGALAYTGSSNFQQYIPGGDCGRQHYLQVSISNTCGASPLSPADPATAYYSFRCSSMRAYPNPAQSSLTVEFEEGTTQDTLPEELALVREETGETVQKVKLGEAYGKKTLTDGNKLIIDVRKHPRGRYYLQIIDSRITTKQKQTLEPIRLLLVN